MFYDDNIDKVFEASVEAVEEAIVSSLYHAETTHGIRGRTAVSLRDFAGKKIVLYFYPKDNAPGCTRQE